MYISLKGTSAMKTNWAFILCKLKDNTFFDPSAIMLQFYGYVARKE